MSEEKKVDIYKISESDCKKFGYKKKNLEIVLKANENGKPNKK